MKTFTINNVTYKSIGFDFNVICDLSDMGIDIESGDVNTLKLVRAYFSLCANISLIEAGKLITEHMRNGGKLDKIIELIFEEFENAGFFQEEQEGTKEDTPKTPAKKKTTTKTE